MEKLKPCPFCGCGKIKVRGSATTKHDIETGAPLTTSAVSFARCEKCGAEIMVRGYLAAVRSKWNHRAKLTEGAL